MTMFRRILFAVLLPWLAGPVLAEREVHVVAVGHGHQTQDFYALPEARVFVDRPGQDVRLVLLDGGDVHWKVDASAGTIISEVLRSGPGSRDGKVTLFGVPMVGAQGPDLPLVFRPFGREFRTLVDSLTGRVNTDRLSSFQGVHMAPGAPLRVDRVDTSTAGLSRDYLSQGVGERADLPPKIRDWVRDSIGDTEATLIFDETGITLSGVSGTRHFAVGSNVPEVVLPSAAVYDPGAQMIYGLTYGGEGHLYSVDVQTGDWALLASLDEYDAAGLLFDPDSRALITTGAFSRPGEIRVFGLDGGRSSILIQTTDFPGLTDLFDYGNEHAPSLIPRAFSGSWLLVEAVAPRPGDDAYRIYAVDIGTGEVRLLDFGND